MNLLIVPKRRTNTKTYNSHGWDDGMDQYLGTVQTVIYTKNGSVKFESCPDYYWNPADLCTADFSEDVAFKGKKQTFNAEDLYL